MDYEKKYNEAMLRADEAVQKGCLDKDMFDIIFPPEETEDERIRKWLVDYFGSIKETVWIHRDITCEQILEWLEKQKEYMLMAKEPVEQKEPENVSASTMAPSCWAEEPSLQKEQKPHEPKNWPADKDNLTQEQKPNSTEDMPYIADEHFYERAPADSFKYKLAEYMTKNCRKEEGPDGYTYAISAETILKMAEEELIKRGVVQKPAWSEEDRKDIREAVDYLRKYATNCVQGGYSQQYVLDLADRIENLRPQPKQMPAEWTDKDKRIIDDVSHLLIMLNYKDMARDYKKAVEKLIYQPHWKPSYEQIEALRRAVNKLAKTDVADSVRLSIMYDNLKKQLKSL